jgi:hypothetical protein
MNNLPKGIEKKNTAVAATPADAVVTFTILTDVMEACGVTRIQAAAAFARAHMALKIKLRADKATGMGWVTADEAAKIREHMIASF